MFVCVYTINGLICNRIQCVSLYAHYLFATRTRVF